MEFRSAARARKGHSNPPFGANGVEFNNEHTILYVADTAYHQIIQIPVNPRRHAGTASIFITGINAPDGIMIDRDDNIWICSNQEDEIVVVDKTGKVIAKLGDFYGIDRNGSRRAFCSRRAWPSVRTARASTSQIWRYICRMRART